MLLLGSLLTSIAAGTVNAGDKQTKSIYDFTVKTIDGKDTPLSAYKRKVLWYAVYPLRALVFKGMLAAIVHEIQIPLQNQSVRAEDETVDRVM